MSTQKKIKTHTFQTEVKQLLNLVINSLYSHKEIFLRELISNASDALDKLRFLAIEKKDLWESDSELNIEIEFNKDKKTIVIRDNGIGMSAKDIQDNLGTIAKSGTKEFLSKLTGDQKKDSHLIGQFGVGFYSSFIVSENVMVKSRAAGLKPEQGVCWVSKGDGEYTLEQTKLTTRGTEITLYLKEEETEFLDNWRLRSIISKYSDHITWPIRMLKVEEEQEKKDEKKVKDNVIQAPVFETVNQATAIWTRSKSEIKDKEYKEFYKHISHDFTDPLLWSHNRLEGKVNYTTLLYIPAKAPFDLMDSNASRGLKLFVNRVFIMDKVEQFLPRYLRFVKGVVDSGDLPLNVSREIMQEHPFIQVIRQSLVKRVLKMLEETAQKNKDQFATIWQEFGHVIKEGLVEDFENRDLISKLIRFATTHNDQDKQEVSLEEYVSRMKPEQEKIYYLTGSNFHTVKNSPHLEMFRKKGVEVILFYDRIDDWVIQQLKEFDGKTLQSIAKGSIEDKVFNTDNSKEKTQEEKKQSADGIIRIKQALGEQVKDVRLTNRLTSSPACMVLEEADMGRQMQHVLKAAGQSVPQSKPILEINDEHPLVKKLFVQNNEAQFKKWCQVILGQALLAEDGFLEKPQEFVQELNELLLETLN